MNISLKDNRQVSIRLLEKSDRKRLFDYLNNLSQESKKRFGPHSFDENTVENICISIGKDNIQRYIAETRDKKMVAYMLVKPGYIPGDAERLQKYGITLNEQQDCTFAPSVADEFQSSGLGSCMFNTIIHNLKKANKKRVILWGGVQGTNQKALGFYTKFGFYQVGEFEQDGNNLDMIKDI